VKNLVKIGDVAAAVAEHALGSCCVRSAWNLVDKNPGIIKRIKRGHYTFFDTRAVNRLCVAIIKGKAAR
jgi:hypothetical protein